MINLSFWNDICTWWPLWWLLPFLLGLLLGWLLWGMWKKRFQDAQNEIKGLNARIKDLEAKLAEERQHVLDHTNETVRLNRTIKSLEADIDRLRSQSGDVDALRAKLEAETKNHANELALLSGKVDGKDSDLDKLRLNLKNSQNSELELSKKIADLETQLAECKKKGDLCVTDLSASTDRIKTLEAQLKQSRSDLKDCQDAKLTLKAPAAGLAATPLTPKVDKYAKLKSDNLQVVEGIGPKMEEVLKENAVSNWSVLAGKSEADLQAILAKYGDKYRIIDPKDWPQQAELAAAGRWDDLIKLQKGLGSDTNNDTDAKVEKLMIKLGIIKQWKQDDLKAIEGIGPKIESILKDAGINTWAGLASTSVDRLNDVLAAAGDRFKLADPTTWPKQADMATKGEWDALEKYQDFLDGGKTPS